ncbi:MAG: hypothetical protein FJ280_05790 [Planctomycetes bacterium]|nr:hypothetical protein [Planctomycetota bacterium]
MKQSPDIVDLDKILRTSPLVAGGFMGDDPRSVTEVIDTDAGTLFVLGVTAKQIAARMRQITDMAAQALGTWTDIDARRQAMVDEVRGALPCSWPHAGDYFKRVTTLQRTDSGQTIRWSDLNIHMIAAHGFFEGRGSTFRTEPAELVAALF